MEKENKKPSFWTRSVFFWRSTAIDMLEKHIREEGVENLNAAPWHLLIEGRGAEYVRGENPYWRIKPNSYHGQDLTFTEALVYKDGDVKVSRGGGVTGH